MVESAHEEKRKKSRNQVFPGFPELKPYRFKKLDKY